MGLRADQAEPVELWWAYDNGVKLCFSRLGKPTDNTIIESFNAQLGIEGLNQP